MRQHLFRTFFITSLLSFAFVVTTGNYSRAQLPFPNDQNAIAQLVRSEFQPITAAPVELPKIVIADNYALVEWIIGQTGGEELLQKSQGKWMPVISSGGAFSLSNLENYKVPASTAVKLLDGIEPIP